MARAGSWRPPIEQARPTAEEGLARLEIGGDDPLAVREERVGAGKAVRALQEPRRDQRPVRPPRQLEAVADRDLLDLDQSLRQVAGDFDSVELHFALAAGDGDHRALARQLVRGSRRSRVHVPLGGGALALAGPLAALGDGSRAPAAAPLARRQIRVLAVLVIVVSVVAGRRHGRGELGVTRCCR